MEKLLQLNGLEAQWHFNIPSLARRVEGINAGHLIMVGARPNTGKTSFHASIIAGEGGFAHQGAKCYVLCNEEAYHRVGIRYLTAASNMSKEEIKDNPALAAMRYDKVRKNLHLKDCTGRDMAYVEQLIKVGRPDIVVLDMGDKFSARTSDKSDVYLRDAAIHARNIAKQYGCAIFWMSQLSADAQNKVMVDMSMMEGSKTGKAAEADLMLLLSKNPMVEGAEEEDSQRHINVAKNKLSGWHGIIHCELDGKRAIYSA
jgi:replicative DNA helicase